MAKYKISANMEFVRSADLGFRAGVAVAAELGYEYVEPMVHTGWELLSEVEYFHSFSMEEDPLLMKEICDLAGVKVSSLSAHSPLMKPEAAIPRLTRAAILADYVGTNILNSDEMVKGDWMNDDRAHEAMRYTLLRYEQVAERHKVYLGIEPHGIYTKTAEGLLRIVNLVPSKWIGVNWDTGNSYLAGIEDPYESLESVRGHVLHVHAKDISFEHAERERGTVTGTPVGCAVGEGVIDWDRTLDLLDPIDRELTLSVECGTIDEAARSIEFLRSLIAKREGVSVSMAGA